MRTGIEWKNRLSQIPPKKLAFAAEFTLGLLTAWTTGLFRPGGMPAVIVPLPFPWFWLALLFGWAVPVLPAALFWLLCEPLSYGKPAGPIRTRVAAALIGILSFMWFYSGWNLGVKYEGVRFTVMTALGSLFFAAAITLILASSRRTRSYAWSLTANFLIFAWAVTYAFPYLGEMP
jgi:hypothetical protein